MTQLEILAHTMQCDAFIISNPTSIFYFTNERFDVGERLLALIVFKNDAPKLVLHEMFSYTGSLSRIRFKDSDSSTDILNSFLPEGTIAVDGTFEARFILPLLKTSKSFIDGSQWIHNLRAIKTTEELELLRIASIHNDEIMAQIPGILRVGITEIEVANWILEKQSTYPLTGTSFTPIAVFTENIADPHGIPSNRPLKEGDVVLIDMGGIYSNYCSDMTRCFFFGRNPELEALHEIVREANETAISGIKPGIPFSDIDALARNVITQAGYGEQFIHRTGHGIGIECHEQLDVSSSNHKLVEVGMCFSIEPGIYLPGIGGIRIEDLVAVTDDGVEVLNHYPKTLNFVPVK